MKRSEATQQEKFITFKRAFETISTHRAQGNHLAAYVVAFSVVEDRIRATYVIWYRSIKRADPNPSQIRERLNK